jgi:hypothetical protein
MSTRAPQPDEQPLVRVVLGRYTTGGYWVAVYDGNDRWLGHGTGPRLAGVWDLAAEILAELLEAAWG